MELDKHYLNIKEYLDHKGVQYEDDLLNIHFELYSNQNRR